MFIITVFNADDPYILWIEQETLGSVFHGLTGEPDKFLTSKNLNEWIIEDSGHSWTSAVVSYKDKTLYLADTFHR